jgi:hypothetical protein
LNVHVTRAIVQRSTVKPPGPRIAPPLRGADPGDRRATLVALTEQGTGLFQEIRTARHAQSEDLFAMLDERDRADLGTILRTVQEAAVGRSESS